MDEETPPDDVSVAIRTKSRRRVLHRVPAQMRENKKHIYDPLVVPLGPYHHGREPHFQIAEQLKNELRDIICNDNGVLLSKISERMDEIRRFYGGADRYSDEELAEMMLRDACFVLCYLKEDEHSELICRRLGLSGQLFMYRDVFMLENQIPMWLINLLISHVHDDDDEDRKRGQSLLCTYLSYSNFGDDRTLTQLPWGKGEEEEPLHLLEAIHRTFIFLLKTEESSSSILQLMNTNSRASRKSEWEMTNSPFRSVTDLNAKGIHFRRSSHCLTDIKFFSFAFYAQLHLPFFYITYNSVVFFSNVIAFEMSPETKTDFGVTSYVNFMKTLIETAKDVKELRKKGILYCRLTDEEVVGIFKSIDTYGFYNYHLLYRVKMRIDAHCNNKAKTWIADLINTKFQTPWTAIALVATAFLICLTFLQTYYTINPRK